ncbi:MAG: hypothetical protein MZW92_50285 [Comamonadaceae bacterium]|nr:hypothetical protein [Comamonadaceae bacterium]
MKFGATARRHPAGSAGMLGSARAASGAKRPWTSSVSASRRPGIWMAPWPPTGRRSPTSRDRLWLCSRLAGIMLLRQQYNDSIAAFKTAIGLDRTNSGCVRRARDRLPAHGPLPARARGAGRGAPTSPPSRKTQIDQVLAWLDSREGSAANGPHP